RPAVDRRRCLLAQQGARAPLAARAAMKDLLATVDETPITFAILILCVTLTVLMDPFHPDRAAVLGYGAVRAVEVADGQPWRLLTYTFVHNGGVVHLLFNMLGAMWLGPSLERSYGSLKFAVLWL